PQIPSPSYYLPTHLATTSLFSSPCISFLWKVFFNFVLVTADRSILEPLLERRASSGARVEDLSLREDSENRIGKFKRKDWSLSKSQVIAEKAPEPDLLSPARKAQRPKSLQLSDSRLTPFHGSSPQPAALSPPPLTPKSTRTLSSPSLQTDGLMTATVPPPPPPKSKPYESSQRNSTEVGGQRPTLGPESTYHSSEYSPGCG
uniref:Uncharacterized protein n=1 Tax=Sus scrofa TaxID=9823 RepID=A0A8D0MXV4_PIG